jgi:polyisoprenoid-binding protein YceI
MNRISSCLVALAVLGTAATSGANDSLRVSGSTVKFHAVGPAGLAIDGSAPEMTFSDKDEKLTFEVPADKLSTGISLRDKHLRRYLNADKHPRVKLVVKRAKVKMPESGDVDAIADAELTLNQITRPVKVHYTLKRGKDGGYVATGDFSVNIESHSIKQPCYLGVCVDTTVKITASVTARGE